MIVKCENEACENNGIPIEVEPPIDEDTGEVSTGWTGVLCGACNEWLHRAPTYRA